MQKQQHVTWGGRFNTGPDALMVQFSESVSFDQRLAPFDIQGSQAHCRMLAQVGLISETERDAILQGLDQIAQEIESGAFNWDPALEDVHMNIEQRLTERVPAAAKLHTARSRNDQVATDMRLFFKWACHQVDQALKATLNVLLERAEATQQIYIPGYTHLQRAQPVSLAHHLLAWVEMLGRDRQRFAQVADAANICPLGSGAIAGTTLPIDRACTAKLLGFVDANGHPRLTTNSMDAVADRDLFLDFAHAATTCGLHISRIAEDVILWNSSEFGFVKLPDTFTTGSSLMPQKKNPDSLEILRGKAARLQGNFITLQTLVKGLPLTYNRDLQEDKPPLFDTLDTLLISLDVLAGTLAGMEPRPDRCASAVADPALLATDLVDYLVLKGKPFREAHHVIGALVALAEKENCPLDRLSLAAVQAIDPLFADDWNQVFDITRAMHHRTQPGMPGPEQVRQQISRWRSELE